MANDDSEGYDLLDRLAEEFAGRFRRGERPSLKEYTERYPKLAEEIRELFPALIRVEQAEEICQDRKEAEARIPPLSEVGDYRIIREIGHGGMGVVYEAEQVSLGRRVALKVLPWQIAKDRSSLERFRREARASARLHHTNIVPVFDVGQDGDIRFYAMQFIHGQSLDLVIRELRKLRGRSRRAPGGRDEEPYNGDGTLGNGATAGVVHSLLTGQLHPSPTVAHAGVGLPSDPAPAEPVSPAAVDSSAVMPGGTQLSSVESRHRAFHRGVAQIGRQVASALAYAHTRGILHRDIKPSNLLLDTEGVVWVSDFGLAKVDDDELTHTGDILGTLRYMAPERFRGQGDARADLYSLGLTLYELLTLRPAFDSPDRLALSEQIKTVDPLRPRSIDPRVPRDLETILLRAIEKDPGQRYATAEVMAEDLRRFLDDEPILARRASVSERYIRWARRHPAIAILGGILTAVVVAVTIASVLVARQMTALADKNRLAAESERDAKFAAVAAQAQADRQRERAEKHLYIARIGQAASALRLDDGATARGLLDLCRPEQGAPDRRGWEWSYLDQWSRPELRTIALPTSAQSRCLAVSPDGRLLAVGCWDPAAVNRRALNPGELSPVLAYVISLPEGGVRHELAGHNVAVNAIAFRPDGRCLATLGTEGTIRVWDTGSGGLLRSIRIGEPLSELGNGLSWSPDGRWLAHAAENVPVRIWDPETGRETAEIARNASSVAWSPDGTRIALGLVKFLGLEVRPWDARGERSGEPVLQQQGGVHGLAWSPDSRRLAVTWTFPSGREPRCRLTVRDATTGESAFQIDESAELGAIAFSPDGLRMATGGDEELVRVFDAASGRLRVALFTGAAQVTGVAFSPDGRRLYAAGWGMGGVKVFDPARDPRGRRLQLAENQIGALTFDREGLSVLQVYWVHGVVRAIDRVDGSARHDLALPVTDSRRWPRADFAFSRDGRRLAAPTRAGPTVVGVWDLALGRPLAMLRGSAGAVSADAFGPDGRAAATAGLRGPSGRPIVNLWDIASGRAIRSFEAGPDPVEALAYSGDGRRLAAGGGTAVGRGWVTVWDVETGAVLATRGSLGQVKSVAFHPDGSRIAVADFGEANVYLWDPSLGTWISRPGPAAVSCVAFTPDGKRLAALGYDGNVHLTDASTGDEVLVLRTFGPPAGHNGFTPRMVFSPDGSRIAANAVDAGLNLWDLGPMSALAAEPESDDVAGWLRRSRALAEQDDTAGALIASSRARDIMGGDASAWIEHAVWLYRRDDAPRAQDAVKRAMASLPDDPGRWLGLVRLLDRLGWTEGSATVRAQAQSLCERLCRAPVEEAAAAVLAELLPEHDKSRDWAILQPDVLTSAAGATLTALPDGSILASGPSPDVDTYTVEAASPLAGITALRLEALRDPSLPQSGPGRFHNGNFILDGLKLTTMPESAAPGPVRFVHARADYWQADEAHKALKGTLVAGSARTWGIWPHVARPHSAVLEASRPFGTPNGMKLQVELAFRSRHTRHTLGRFRLSVTNRPFPLFRSSLQAIKADSDRDGWTRLGAAYALNGDWTSAGAVLAPATAGPDASALDAFLLALAHHHLGRLDEAGSDCDRALARFKSDSADEAAHDVGIEALMTIRGLTVGEAESALQDLVFPAEPFGPL